MYFTPINSKPRNLTQNYAFLDPTLKQQNYEKGTAMFNFDLIAKCCMHTHVVPLALIKIPYMIMNKKLSHCLRKKQIDRLSLNTSIFSVVILLMMFQLTLYTCKTFKYFVKPITSWPNLFD